MSNPINDFIGWVSSLPFFVQIIIGVLLALLIWKLVKKIF